MNHKTSVMAPPAVVMSVFQQAKLCAASWSWTMSARTTWRPVTCCYASCVTTEQDGKCIIHTYAYMTCKPMHVLPTAQLCIPHLLYTVLHDIATLLLVVVFTAIGFTPFIAFSVFRKQKPEHFLWMAPHCHLTRTWFRQHPDYFSCTTPNPTILASAVQKHILKGNDKLTHFWNTAKGRKFMGFKLQQMVIL